jgi:cyclic pyranopterin phosphate synthase
MSPAAGAFEALTPAPCNTERSSRGRRAWIARVTTLRYSATVKLYSFDVDGERLDRVPLAARRALDHAGWKLSLAGWESLALDQRRDLVRLGSAAAVDVADVARRVAQARPAATRCEVALDPAPDAPAMTLVETFAPYGRLSPAIWLSLSDLDRYALQKVAARDNPERVSAAYAEIVGYRQVSTHLGPAGGAQMVNVGAKPVTQRRALAASRVSMKREAFELLQRQAVPKGDVLGTARIAGILAAKRTAELIPLCHAVPLSQLTVDLRLEADTLSVYIEAHVQAEAKTGVEMEALVAVSHAALTVYDMLKALDRGMQIGPTRLLAKSGGASGDFRAITEAP